MTQHSAVEILLVPAPVLWTSDRLMGQCSAIWAGEIGISTCMMTRGVIFRWTYLKRLHQRDQVWKPIREYVYLLFSIRHIWARMYKELSIQVFLGLFQLTHCSLTSCFRGNCTLTNLKASHRLHGLFQLLIHWDSSIVGRRSDSPDLRNCNFWGPLNRLHHWAPFGYA